MDEIDITQTQQEQVKSFEYLVQLWTEITQLRKK
jgi:hypothetical protein